MDNMPEDPKPRHKYLKTNDANQAAQNLSFNPKNEASLIEVYEKVEEGSDLTSSVALNPKLENTVEMV